MSTINHLKGWKILQRDQARRLRYQERQRVVSKVVGDKNVNANLPYTWDGKLTEGQIKSFVSKLVK